MTENPVIMEKMLRIKAEAGKACTQGLFAVWVFIPWKWDIIATGLTYDEAMALADAHGLAKVTKMALEEQA